MVPRVKIKQHVVIGRSRHELVVMTGMELYGANYVRKFYHSPLDRL
jgi:hypothetical protein